MNLLHRRSSDDKNRSRRTRGSSVRWRHLGSMRKGKRRHRQPARVSKETYIRGCQRARTRSCRRLLRSRARARSRRRLRRGRAWARSGRCLGGRRTSVRGCRRLGRSRARNMMVLPRSRRRARTRGGRSLRGSRARAWSSGFLPA
jgi:hypothetical protein